MKRNILTTILLFYCITAFSQTWERFIGAPNRPDAFQNFCESYDGGFLVLGQKYFYPNTRGFITKTNINGDILYDITLGIANQLNIPQFISPTNDGGAIICGAYQFWSEVSDVGVVKLNACGDLDWCKVWKTDSYNSFFGIEIQQLPDGGYIMLANHNLEDSSHVWLYRLDIEGNPLWKQSYANYSDYPISSNIMDDLHLTSQDKYLLSGACWWYDSSGSGISRLKAMVIQVDSSGSEEWVSAFMTDIPEYYTSANSDVQKGSGNYYIGAIHRTEVNPSMLIVMDTLGNFIHDTIPQIPNIGSYLSTGWLKDLTFLSDGRLFAHNDMMVDFNDYKGHFALHELDSLGGLHNTFFREYAHGVRSKILLTSDGKLLAGSVVGSSSLQKDIILMKLNTSLEYDSIYTFPRQYDYLCPDAIVSKTIDLDCEVIVDVKNIPTSEDYYKSIKLIPITPAPNPANHEVKFMLKNTAYHKNITLVCYNINGRQMESLHVNTGIEEVSMNVSTWTPGMYMTVVYSGNKKVGSTRFVVGAK